MSNLELLTTAYANAHRATDLVEKLQIANQIIKLQITRAPGEIPSEWQEQLDALDRVSRELHSAALQLAARCRGVKPPKDG